VQVFGNGLGKAVHFGERECSIQRRHQKIIEECPSPFVAQHPELRAQLGAAAVHLAESVNYGSAGTVEYLVDDATGEFFFLEKHGVTELCYNRAWFRETNEIARNNGKFDYLREVSSPLIYACIISSMPEGS
ncbi:hypothetical protein EXIGLDRAFT_784081, partial [Exidia glandulosa HHB12029]